MKFYANPYSFDVSLHRCVKASLLPHAGSSSSAWSLCTRPSSSLTKPSFGEHFPLAVPRAALASKTLQATIWAVAPDVEEECLGSAQVSLADFDCGAASVRWYNVLSFRFMQQPEEQSKQQQQQQQQQQRQKTTARQRLLLASPKQQQSRLAAAAAAATESVSRQGTLKEESSDESTAISSQASTLTRDNGGAAGLSPAALAIAARLAEGEEAVEESGDEDEEDEDDEDDDVIIPTLPEVLESFDAIQAAANKADLVSAY